MRMRLKVDGFGSEVFNRPTSRRNTAPSNKPFVYLPPVSNASRDALITIAVGDKYKWMFDLTIPKMMEYCKKHKLQFFCIDDTWRNDEHPCYLKQHVYWLLRSGRIKRACYTDSDMLWNIEAPNIFDVVPEGFLGMYPENTHYTDYKGSDYQKDFFDYIAQYRTLVDVNIKVTHWDEMYCNAGLFVCDLQTCPHIPPVKDVMYIPSRSTHNMKGFYDQHYVNLMRIIHNIPTQYLPSEWNYFRMKEGLIKKDPKEAYVIHYCSERAKLLLSGRERNFQFNNDIKKKESPVPVKINTIPASNKKIINILGFEYPKKWILDHMADILIQHSPADMTIVWNKTPLKGDNVINLAWPYRAFQKTVTKSVTFHTHPEKQPAWIQSARDATHITVMCEKYKQELIKQGIPAEKITRITPGIDPDFTFDFTVFFPSRLYEGSRRKGTDLWKSLQKALPGINFVCSDGKMEKHKLVTLMKTCDCVFVPSNMEGGPMCVLEALRCGTPVICSHDVGLCKEFSDVIIDYRLSDVESAKRAILSVYTEKKKRYDRVASLTWDRWANEYYSVFRKVFNEAKS